MEKYTPAQARQMSEELTFTAYGDIGDALRSLADQVEALTAERDAAVVEDAQPVAKVVQQWAGYPYYAPLVIWHVKELPVGTSLYAAAQPVALEPLTDTEIFEIGTAARAIEGNHILPVTFARAIEARLRGNIPLIPLHPAAVAEGLKSAQPVALEPLTDAQIDFDQAAWMLNCYAEFLKTDVASSELEWHPYLPDMEDMVERLRAAAKSSVPASATQEQAS